RKDVPGDICEFGSYKGHSGYLLSRLIEAEKSEKKLFMFDMFEHFPDESAGVDAFWSKTHQVDFEEVKAKFENRKNTTLIKGDFTQTLFTVELDKISLIYVDCDSYRATLFLMEELFEKRLSEKGMMIFEDYGHPALLGNRLAIHRFFDSRTDCICFFSQFSGYYIVIKSS
ncbi:MAG: TylF/MycF/NovP-related O-methyltransferase, partial [Bacteroidota bacterium]